MSWIAEYDTQGREFPTCVHVTKTTGTMTHGATYVPIEDGEAVRAENAKLRELLGSVFVLRHDSVYKWLDASTEEICGKSFTEQARELGFEVPE